MAGVRGNMNTFNAGEVGRQVRARHDTQKYQSGLDEAYNVLLLPAGGAYIRPGTLFAGELRDSTALGRLFPFIFSLNQSNVLEFSDGVMRVYYGGALVLRPELVVTAATQTNPLTVTVPDSGYEVGWDIYFTGQLGMTELNGQTLRITAIVGDALTFGGVNATGWGAWTGSTGGVPGDDEGGTGGYPPYDPDEPPPPFDDDTDPPPVIPPKCVWVETWLVNSLKAGSARVGSPLRKMREDGFGTFNGLVEAISFATRPGYRLVTESGVVATVSDTAPIPIKREEGIVYIRASAVDAGWLVPVEDADGFRWEPIVSVNAIGVIRVAQITTGDGVYGAGDIMGRMLFTHNIKPLPED